MTNPIYPIFCFFLFLLSCFPALLHADASFLFPDSDSDISKEKIQIIGVLSEEKSQALLSVNNSLGEKKYPLAASSKVFYQTISLAEGLNQIELYENQVQKAALKLNRVPRLPERHKVMGQQTDKSVYYLHPKENLTENCSACHQANSTSLKQYRQVAQEFSCITALCHVGFDKGTFLHGPFQEGSCVECHNPHGATNRFFLKYKKEKLCFSCHSEASNMVEEGKHIHFPVLKGECTSCHDPHKSNLEFHLKRNTMKELCAGCHGSIITDHEVLHDPVESGDCNACHSAHTSEYKWLLYKEGEALCLTCHEVRKEEFASRFVHEPVAKNCNLCHDPHGSASIYHLITPKNKDGVYLKSDKPIQDLCISCHRKLDPEVIEQIENSKNHHKPVKEGKCTVCHTPHSTNFKKQLKEPLKNTCYTCHKKIQKKIESSLFKHGPIRSDNCTQCHLVHGSNNRKLLRSKFSRKFSGPFLLDNYELCFNCHNPKVVLEKTSEDTGFRNGTRNLHFLHVNDSKKGRNCSTCHNIHASDQEKHIRKKVPFKRNFTIKLAYTKTASGGGCVVGCHKPKKYDRIKPVKN